MNLANKSNVQDAETRKWCWPHESPPFTVDPESGKISQSDWVKGAKNNKKEMEVTVDCRVRAEDTIHDPIYYHHLHTKYSLERKLEFKFEKGKKGVPKKYVMTESDVVSDCCPAGFKKPNDTKVTKTVEFDVNSDGLCYVKSHRESDRLNNDREVIFFDLDRCRAFEKLKAKVDPKARPEEFAPLDKDVLMRDWVFTGHFENVSAMCEGGLKRFVEAAH